MSSGPLTTLRKREPCGECNALVDVGAYHPYAFCVLVKAGLDPEEVVCAAVRYYDRNGWPESRHVDE